MHKAVFMAQLHYAGGGARDVAGRGTPARNAIGQVRRTWAGGICGGVKESVPLCEFASRIKSKASQIPLICDEVQMCMTKSLAPASWFCLPRLRNEEPAAMLKFRYL